MDIDASLFTKYELIKATKRFQYGKATSLDEIPKKVWKKDEF